MFEMFFRSCNCCRHIKTQKSRKWYTNQWGSQERRNEFCLGVWREGNPTIHVQKSGAWILPSTCCVAALRHLGSMPRWKRGCPWENLNSTRDACFKNKSIPFCRAALEVVIKVKSGPAEAGGEVPMDFGLFQIPPPGFDCCPAAAWAWAWPTALHWVSFCSHGMGPRLYLTNKTNRIIWCKGIWVVIFISVSFSLSSKSSLNAAYYFSPQEKAT